MVVDVLFILVGGSDVIDLVPTFCWPNLISPPCASCYPESIWFLGSLGDGKSSDRDSFSKASD